MILRKNESATAETNKLNGNTIHVVVVVVAEQHHHHRLLPPPPSPLNDIKVELGQGNSNIVGSKRLASKGIEHTRSACLCCYCCCRRFFTMSFLFITSLSSQNHLLRYTIRIRTHWMVDCGKCTMYISTKANQPAIGTRTNEASIFCFTCDLSIYFMLTTCCVVSGSGSVLPTPFGSFYLITLWMIMINE